MELQQDEQGRGIIWGVHSVWADGMDNLVLFFRTREAADAWVANRIPTPTQHYEVERLTVEPEPKRPDVWAMMSTHI